MQGVRFDWSISPQGAIDWVSNLQPRLTAVTASAGGSERRETGGWSVIQYVCHVGDNLRQWSERLQGARLAGTEAVSGYDADDLALARRYETLPLAAALWSTGHAIAPWVSVLTAAVAEAIVLEHETRGTQRAEDVARNNCHDAQHHLWDISQILSGDEPLVH